MARSKGKPPSQRQLRVGEELRHALVRVLTETPPRDPGLRDSQITITEVRVSPDLRNATVFVMPLGGGDLAGKVAALDRAAPYLRARLADNLDLRFTPRLAFQADRSFDEADRIASLLASPRVSRDLQSNDEFEAEEPNNRGS